MSKSHGTWPVQGRAKCAKENERGQFGTIILSILRWRKTCQNAKSIWFCERDWKSLNDISWCFSNDTWSGHSHSKGKGKRWELHWASPKSQFSGPMISKVGWVTYIIRITYIDSMTHLCQWCHSRVQHDTASPATHKSNVKQEHLKYFTILELRRTSTSTSPNRQHFTPATSRNHFT